MMKKTTFISLAGLALLPLSNVSYADYDGEQKAYAGSGCEPFYAREATRFRKVRSSFEVTDQDQASEPLFVTCPIVRDNVSNLDGTKAAYVYVEKLFPGVGFYKDVACTLFSDADTGGDDPVEAKSVQTLESRAGSFSLDVDVDVNASRPGGPYTLVCRLPPGGAIHSYIIAEY